MKYSEDLHCYLQKKVGRMLSSLEREQQDLLKCLLNLEREVDKTLEIASISVDQLTNTGCSEANLKKVYQEVNLDLEVMDAWITILSSTISNNNADLEDDLGSDWKDNPGLGGSSNYLLRKVWGKLTVVKREGEIVIKNLGDLVKKVEFLIAEARESVITFDNCKQGNVLEVFMEVSKKLWLTDMEMMMIRARLPNCLPVFTDKCSDYGDHKRMVHLHSQIGSVTKMEKINSVLTSRPILKRRHYVPSVSTGTSLLMINKMVPFPPPFFPALNSNTKNCVTVVIKSSRLDSKNKRQTSVNKRVKQVNVLVNSFELRFSHVTSPEVQVRMDYCFQTAEEASKFYKEVSSLEPKHSSPKGLISLLLSEAELGYQYEPVLTEHDLLCIQSSGYCRNLFRTSVLIKVIQVGDIVSYKFKSVTDVNKFLFNKSSSSRTRSLGLLRMNVKPKRLIPDQNGFYGLFTCESQISLKFGDSDSDRHKFRISQVGSGEEYLTGGNILLFDNRFDLFQFLVSKGGADLSHLQFDETKIEDLVLNY